MATYPACSVIGACCYKIKMWACWLNESFFVSFLHFFSHVNQIFQRIVIRHLLYIIFSKNVLDKSRDKDIKYLQRVTLKMYKLKQPYVSHVLLSVNSSQEYFLRFTMWTVFAVFSPVPSQKSALIYIKLCQNPLKYCSNMLRLQLWQTPV